MKLRIKFVPQDIWIGLYWKREHGFHPFFFRYTFYLCILPMIPIILEIDKNPKVP